jgi:hypothetical protein
MTRKVHATGWRLTDIRAKRPTVYHTHLLVGRDSTYCGAKPGFSTVTDFTKATCPKCRRAGGR